MRACAEQLTPTAKRYAQISRLLRLDTSSVRQSALNMIRTARTFIKKMNMPCTIEAAGVTKEQFEAELDEMAAAALADRCHGYESSAGDGRGHQGNLPARLL